MPIVIGGAPSKAGMKTGRCTLGNAFSARTTTHSAVSRTALRWGGGIRQSAAAVLYALVEHPGRGLDIF
jgi:hypothetical protein